MEYWEEKLSSLVHELGDEIQLMHEGKLLESKDKCDRILQTSKEISEGYKNAISTLDGDKKKKQYEMKLQEWQNSITKAEQHLNTFKLQEQSSTSETPPPKTKEDEVPLPTPVPVFDIIKDGPTNEPEVVLEGGARLQETMGQAVDSSRPEDGLETPGSAQSNESFVPEMGAPVLLDDDKEPTNLEVQIDSPERSGSDSKDSGFGLDQALDPEATESATVGTSSGKGSAGGRVFLRFLNSVKKRALPGKRKSQTGNRTPEVDSQFDTKKNTNQITNQAAWCGEDGVGPTTQEKEEVEELASRMTPASKEMVFDLLDHPRVLLRQGTLSRKVALAGLRKASHPTLFIFSDLLLLGIASKSEQIKKNDHKVESLGKMKGKQYQQSSPELQKSSPEMPSPPAQKLEALPTYEITHAIPLENISLKDLSGEAHQHLTLSPNSTALIQHRQFEISFGSEVLTFTAETEEEKKSWVKCLWEACCAQVERLRPTSDLEEGWRHQVLKGTLHSASFHGELKVVEHLVSRLSGEGFPSDLGGGCDYCCQVHLGGLDCLETPDADGRAPLHLAALAGHTQIVKYFIQQGANALSLDDSMNTPLHLASWQGHLPAVTALLSEYNSPDSINSLNMEDRNAAYLVVQNGEHQESSGRILEELREKGANLDYPDLTGRTPLHLSVENNLLRMAACLVDLGSDPNVKNGTGLTALQLACKAVAPDVEMIRILLGGGAYPNVRSPFIVELPKQKKPFLKHSDEPARALTMCPLDLVLEERVSSEGSRPQVQPNRQEALLQASDSLPGSPRQSPSPQSRHSTATGYSDPPPVRSSLTPDHFHGENAQSPRSENSAGAFSARTCPTSAPTNPALQKKVNHALDMLPCLLELVRSGARLEFSVLAKDIHFFCGLEDAAMQWSQKECPEQTSEVMAGLRRLPPHEIEDEKGAPPTTCLLCLSRKQIFGKHRQCHFCTAPVCGKCSSKQLPQIFSSHNKTAAACDSCFNQACYRAIKLQISLANIRAGKQRLQEQQYINEHAELVEHNASELAPSTVHKASSEMDETLKNMHIRGKQLEDIGSKAETLAQNAANFKEMARQLNENSKPSWWKF